MLRAEMARLTRSRHTPRTLLIGSLVLILLQSIALVGPVATAGADSPALSMVEGADTSHWGYSSASVTVTAGQALTWTNTGQMPHTATADEGAWDTGVVPPGSVASITLSTPGTYTYHCTVHPWMKATVVVAAPASDDAPTPSDTVPAEQE